MSLIRFRLAQLFPIAGVVTLLAFAGCASSTVLQSQPAGAEVFLNSVRVGTTPYTMTDQNIVGTVTQVRLEYPGYQQLNTYISRNEELDPLALIGGCLVLVPFLWIMKYQAVHYYQLQPLAGAPQNQAYPPAPGGYPPPTQGAYPPAPEGAYPPPAQGSYPAGPAGYPPPPPGYPPAAGQPQPAPAGQ